MNLDDLITALILIASFYGLFFIGKLVNDFLHREYRLTEELVEKDNPALALAISGYYLGLVLAIGGALSGPSNGVISDLIDLVIYGLEAVVLLNLSWWCCDRLILNRCKLADELIRDRNAGAGAVCFGAFTASGIIIFGSITGTGGNIWTALVFWGIGQGLLVVTTKVYDGITSYSIHDEIEKDNVAAGVGFAGALAAIGIITGFAARLDFTSWENSLYDFVTMAVFGFVMLPVARVLTDRILLPTRRLSDEIAGQEVPNIGAAFIEAVSYIGAAFVICWCA
ncbi:MAG: DUF350 domain-containing protein [Desulfobacterales bacterium]|nr:MAG: DUF350 domain-containing protein [Desulfobacterales bacterium]